MKSRYSIFFYLLLALLLFALLFIALAFVLPRFVDQTGVVIILFAVSVGTLLYVAVRLYKPLVLLNEFVEILSRHDHSDFSRLNFPGGRLGQICRKIVATFEQLERTKRYKQEMSHNIAHELKTPVTSIRAYLETMLQDEEMEPQQRALFVERAYNQTLRLSDLINDVSTLNKLDEGEATFLVEEFSISSCVKDVMEELGYKMRENNVVLRLLISSDLRLKGCYKLVYSLFKNLIDNSIEHGGPNVTIKIMGGVTQVSGEGGYRIDFRYMDNGKNVPQEKLPRLFERFYRIEQGRSRKSGGTGLGLAIVKNAVLFHKGTIFAENNPGGGLIFKFTLYSL